MTTSNNKWQGVTASDATSNSKLKRVAQRVTKNEREWEPQTAVA